MEWVGVDVSSRCVSYVYIERERECVCTLWELAE